MDCHFKRNIEVVLIKESLLDTDDLEYEFHNQTLAICYSIDSADDYINQKFKGLEIISHNETDGTINVKSFDIKKGNRIHRIIYQLFNLI
jgi:hypothetical protein